MEPDPILARVASHRRSVGARVLVWATRLATLVPLMVGVVWAGGCHEDRVGGPVVPILLLQKAAANSGDEQSDTVLATLASPLRVLVLRDSLPAMGVAVTWRVPDGQGSVSESTTATDADGIASVTRTLGPTAGTHSTEASLVSAVGSRITFTATARLRPLALAVVSDPVVPVTASAPGAAGMSLSASDSEVVYVSLPPEAMPNGEAATVRNLRTGAFVRTVMTAGGFDPVAVGASVGDTLELEIRMTAGASPQKFAVMVPAMRRPIVVRTDPPPRKLDVPLNASMMIVFSEPIARGTITVQTMRLLRGGQPVAGRAVLSGDGLRAEFQPDNVLAPQTEYSLSLTTDVADLAGTRLAQPLDVSFTTGASASNVASVVVTPAEAAVVDDSTSVLSHRHGSVQLTATARDLSGAVITGGTTTWASSNPQVAQVSPTGRVSGVSPGTVTITATVDGLSGTAAITVLTSIYAISLQPSSATLEVGATLALVASATDAAGQPVTGYRVDWYVPPHLTLVSATGGTANVRGTIPGSEKTCAYFSPPTGDTWGGTCADILVPNRNPVASVTVRPDTLRTVPTPYAIGYVIAAILRDSAGNEILFGPGVGWSISGDTVARLSEAQPKDGRALAYVWGTGAVGSATITASLGSLRGTAAVLIDYVTLSAAALGMNGYRCYLTPTGSAYCQGLNDRGQLGLGFASSNAQVPVAVAGGLRFTAISTGFLHTCALTLTGAAYCWGYNGQGQLGNNSTTDSPTPVAVAGGLSFTQISAKGYHNCALTAAGRAYCWGFNEFGQLGDGTTTDRSVPVAVGGGLTFTQISAGGGYACGLTAQGAAYCWGENSWGQLGDGTTTSASTPVAVAGGLTFANISGGGGHTCAITTSGATYCWGYNGLYALGNGSSTNSATPVQVALPASVTLTQIDAGYETTCGLATDGAAYCWGYTYDAAWNEVAVPPTRVPGGLVFASVTSGSGTAFGSCGVTRDPAVYCWLSTGTPVRVEGQR